MQIQATIDTHIRFDPKPLSKNILEELLGRLRIKNSAKLRAQKELVWNADCMPDYIELWKWDNSDLLELPRGFVFEFEKILEDNDIEVKWNYEYINYLNKEIFENIKPIDLRMYQSEAVSELMSYRNGIYKAPTGSGKTRVMLELIRRCAQPTIIICEKKDILQQWVDSAREFGFDYTTWVDGEVYGEIDCNLHIALRQTILSNEKFIHNEVYYAFGCVVVDECHHCSSDSMFDLVQRFSALYRFGCSATPDSDPEIFPISRAVIGPVVHITSPEKAQSHLVIPSVRVVDTEFQFEYVPTYKDERGRTVRNNYNSMMKVLEENYIRNKLIAKSIIFEAINGHDCIVISKRKNHLKYISSQVQDLLGWNCSTMISWLTGENSQESELIALDIEKRNKNIWKGSILFSTLAEEGTNIPRLDRLFLTYPGRKSRGFEQAIGRIMRPFPGKKDAVVYDFRDHNISLLNNQFRERAQMIYNKRGYEVEYINEI